MNSVLITGCTGFLGAHAACYLTDKGHSVIALGGQRPFAAELRERSQECLTCDLSDLGTTQEILKRVQPRVLIHCAALARSAACEKDPASAQRANVAVTQNICHALSLVSPHTALLHLSTDLVFEGKVAPSGGFFETEEPSPQTIYTKTKCEAEQIVKHYAGAHCILRTSLIYGPQIGGVGGVLAWMLKSLAEANPLGLFIDEWRTPVFVLDVCEAFHLLISKINSAQTSFDLNSEVLHIAGPERVNRFEFGQALCRVFELNPALLQRQSRRSFTESFRPEDVSLSIGLARRLINYRPRTIFDGFQESFKILSASGHKF